MPIRWMLLTLVCVAMIAVGQVLFKSAAQQWNVDGWTAATAKSFLSPPMILALFVYGLATVLWVLVLRAVPLSVAYPFYALVFLIVPVLAHFAFGEPLTANAMIGGAIIMIGVIIAVR